MTCWTDPASCRGCHYCIPSHPVDPEIARKRDQADALVLRGLDPAGLAEEVTP